MVCFNNKKLLCMFFSIIFTYVWTHNEDNNNQPRTLILYDHSSLLSTHSTFINIIKNLNHIVTEVVTSKSTDIILHRERLYDNILILLKCTDSSKFVIPIDDITKFLDNGGNMMLIVDTKAPVEIKKLINELGYNMLSSGSQLISNRTLSIDSNVTTVDVEKNVIDSKAILDRDILINPLIYKGNALKPMPDNPWTIDILLAPIEDSFYSAVTNSYYPTIIKGLRMVLVGAVQMRNNHRAVIIPSIEFTSNKYLNEQFFDNDQPQKSIISSNLPFVKEVLLWNFLEKSVLRVFNSSHRVVTTNNTKKQYSVMEKIQYSVNIEEKTPDGWRPFNDNNVKFSLERMITHMRHVYNQTKDGFYTTTFYIPDYIGLYKCITEYNKTGYTRLNHFIQIVVRPRRHDEFPRYIKRCWPFYLTPFLMLSMTIMLLFVVTNIKDEKIKKE